MTDLFAALIVLPLREFTAHYLMIILEISRELFLRFSPVAITYGRPFIVGVSFSVTRSFSSSVGVFKMPAVRKYLQRKRQTALKLRVKN